MLGLKSFLSHAAVGSVADPPRRRGSGARVPTQVVPIAPRQRAMRFLARPVPRQEHHTFIMAIIAACGRRISTYL